jgi:hypothetical protein
MYGAGWWPNLCEDSSLSEGPGFDPRRLQKKIYTTTKRVPHGDPWLGHVAPFHSP